MHCGFTEYENGDELEIKENEGALSGSPGPRRGCSAVHGRMKNQAYITFNHEVTFQQAFAFWNNQSHCIELTCHIAINDSRD